MIGLAFLGEGKEPGDRSLPRPCRDAMRRQLSTGSASALILDFPASWIVRNTSLLSKPSSWCDFCYSSPNWLRQYLTYYLLVFLCKKNFFTLSPCWLSILNKAMCTSKILSLKIFTKPHAMPTTIMSTLLVRNSQAVRVGIWGSQ